MRRDQLTLAKTSAPGPPSDESILAAAKGGSIVFFGQLFDYASRFAFGIVVARALGADGFGLYTLGITISVMLASVARLGISEGVVHFLPAALHQRDEHRVRGILQVGLILPVVLGLGLAMVLFVLADPLAKNLLRDPTAATVLRLLSVCIPIIALGRILMASTRGFKIMRYEVYADNIAFSITKLGLTVLLLALGWELLGALLAFAIAWIVSDLLMLFFLNRLYPLRQFLGPAKRGVRQLLAFSAPVCLTQVVTQVGANIELLMLSVVSTMAAVGVYSAALRIQAVGAMLLTASQAVAKPIIADLYHQRDWAQLARLYQTLTRWSLSFILPYFLTILLFANPILSIFGEEFERGSLILIIVSLGTLVNAGTGICGAMIVMTGHSKLTFFNSLISAGLSVTLSLILIPSFGLVGVAVAAALSTALINLIRLAQVYWLHKLWPYSRAFYKPLLASAVTVVVSYGLARLVSAQRNLLYLLLNVLVLWSVYFATLWLLRLSDEDRMVLGRAKKRFNMVFVQH
jgi:O-antigen/teichoic acid export membrane protein